MIPDSDAQLRRQITEFVADAADVDVDDVDADENFYEAHGLDSLGILTVFIDMKDAFGVEEPDADADWEAYSTVNVLVAYVQGQRA